MFTLLCVSLASCQAEAPLNTYKINGLSLEASRDSLLPIHINRIKAVNANAVSLMPFAFLRSTNEPELIFNADRQWFGERKEGIEHAISLLHQKNISVMMKPQIWIRGQFTGDLSFKSKGEWKEFETSYREFILLFTRIAAENDVEIMCMGTELFNFVKSRPEFWKKLISEVRKEFKGKLVYAENWDKVDLVSIWKDLDYIGVDAYFPINMEAAPDVEKIKKGWQIHKNMLANLSKDFNKPVLFTEYGYRSVDYALKEPWDSGRENYITNYGLQARALSVLYEEIWPEPWFAGGYLWKWHQDESAGGLENDRFTPQNKPAENVVKEYYRKFRN
ncbi:glycoside hydrolase [Gramella sp. AN32]|nr:glycoside hydrolase [Gramella sp. AN32]